MNCRPTITRDYLCGHAYNLGFTLPAPGGMGLALTPGILSGRAGGGLIHPDSPSFTLIRGYLCTLRHRRVGVKGNGMIGWNVPGEALDEACAKPAATPEVSHCYAPESIPDFPVFTSSRECKKVRLRGFLPELGLWWSTNSGHGGKEQQGWLEK